MFKKLLCPFAPIWLPDNSLPPSHPKCLQLFLTLFFFILALAGCATETATSTTKEERLSARASEYWQHKIRRDFEKTFAMEDAESLNGISLSGYIRSFGPNVSWKNASIVSVDVSEDKPFAYVTMEVQYEWRFPLPTAETPLLKSQLLEKWVYRNGVWYHFYQPPFAKEIKELDTLYPGQGANDAANHSVESLPASSDSPSSD